MTNTQLYLSIGIPVIVILIGILINTLVVLWQSRAVEKSINARISGLEQHMAARFEAAHQALLRVEGVMDARLKHLEER